MLKRESKFLKSFLKTLQEYKVNYKPQKRFSDIRS